MDDIVIALFAGPAECSEHAIDVAERAGFAASMLRSARSGGAFVQLLDVLTDDTVDVAEWSERTIATAGSIMGSLGFELVSLNSPRLV